MQGVNSVSSSSPAASSETVPADLATKDFAHRSGVALVVGGSGGLGRAVAEMLAARGSNVAITWRSNEEAANETVAAITAHGVDGFAYQADLLDSETCVQMVNEVAETGDGIHAFVHAAGPLIPQVHLSRVEPEFFRHQMEQEIAGFFNGVQPALAHLRATRGSVTAITTAATQRYPTRDGLSPAAKGAVEQIVWGLAAEEGRFGIRANCVGPGMIQAGMALKLDASGDLTEKDYEAATRNIPLRTFGTADDIAEAVCFLASDRARYISGQYLAVDGGYGV